MMFACLVSGGEVSGRTERLRDRVVESTEKGNRGGALIFRKDTSFQIRSLL